MLTRLINGLSIRNNTMVPKFRSGGPCHPQPFFQWPIDKKSLDGGGANQQASNQLAPSQLTPNQQAPSRANLLREKELFFLFLVLEIGFGHHLGLDVGGCRLVVGELEREGPLPLRNAT